MPLDLVHRERRERDQRQREVDREDGDGDEADRARDVPRRVARLLGQVRDRFDPGVGDHRHRDRDEERAPGRRDAPVDVVDEDRRAEDEDEADDHEQELRREVDDRERDVQSRGLLDPDDVQGDEQDDHDRAADDVPRVVLERPPEDRQVVRDEERRDRDRDHVVQELRPRGAEADELVERVAREARGAAGLRVADGSFHVGQGRGREDQARDHEDDRGQAEREGGRDAERVVDRRADVAVRRREQRGRAENALEPLLPPATALGGSRPDRFGFGRAHGGRLSLRPAAVALNRARPHGNRCQRPFAPCCRNHSPPEPGFARREAHMREENARTAPTSGGS